MRDTTCLLIGRLNIKISILLKLIYKIQHDHNARHISINFKTDLKIYMEIPKTKEYSKLLEKEKQSCRTYPT